MGTDLLAFTHFLNGLLMAAIPIGLGVYLTRKFRLGWWLFWIGAGTFVLSQVGHIPFNYLLTVLFQRGILPSPPLAWSTLFNAIVLGLSAGLWEELMRFAAYRWWAKDARSWRKAILMGAGHGGIEAIITGLLVLVTFLQMLALRGADLSTLVPPEQLELARQQVSAYWSSPWYMNFLGAVERIFTLPMHIALSVLVLQCFTRRQARWLVLAILWHAFVNAVAIVASRTWGVGGMGGLAVEGLIGISALINLGIIFALRRPEPEAAAEDTPAPAPAVRPELPPVEETEQNLESTRFD
jgi:uncharacterized membrane protein YhfC